MPNWSHIHTGFHFSLSFALLNLALVGTVLAQEPSRMLDVWIGTSSARPSKGIYYCRLDANTGRLTDPVLAAEMGGPGFLAMHPKGKHLYAVGAVDGKPSVAAFAISHHGDHSALSLVNSLEIGDGGAAHVSVDRTGQTLLTAQYGGGSVAAFALNPDGSLKERTQLVEHQGGSGSVSGRQEAPHPHWTGFSPDNRFAFVPDLGLDQVVIYRVDVETARLTPHGIGQLPAGAGPRHMKFHTNGRWIYVLNELDLSITRFDYDAQEGTMTPRETLPTVPKEQLIKEPFKSASEIRVHPSGQFVYSANRGHDTVTAFRVDQETGALTVLEREPVRGATPRNFNLDPSGRWLLAAGQNSHTLASFAVDPQTGELSYTGTNVTAPSAICVLFTHE